MPEKKRPLSISIISWFLTVAGGIVFLFLLRLPALKDMPEFKEAFKAQGVPSARDTILSLIVMSVYIISGIAMLKGKNWGRYLYLWVSGASILLSLVIHKFDRVMIPGIMLYLTFFLLLTRKTASDFFYKEKIGEEYNQLEKEEK